MADLSTQYLGLQLPTPLVLASSALSNRVDNLEIAEGHGAGAVVLRSLFAIQCSRVSAARRIREADLRAHTQLRGLYL